MNKETILVVEDERIIAIDLQRRLERFGYIVCGLAATGEAAIKRATEQLPDIVIMDIMLTGEIDGIEAAKYIKEKLHIPVIFLTAYSDEKTLERAKEAEPFGYILKPFKEKELYTTIDIALYKHSIDKQLRKQERLFSAILHNIGDGIIATDRNNIVQFLNPIAQEITGYTEEEAKGQPLTSLLKILDEKTENPLALPELDSLNEETYYFTEALVINKNGIPVHTQGTVSNIHDKDKSVEGQVIAIRDTTEMRRLSETISYQASHDTLTGLANREEFSNRLSLLIENARASSSQHALIYLDIDQFKVINDTCGHAVGDEMLLEATNVIKSVVRSSDLCARLGGDEFGIILEHCVLEKALFIAQRLHTRLNESKVAWQENLFTISSSIGLVMINEQSVDLSSVLAAADDACYVAKDEGGNRIRIYETTGNLFLKRRGEMQWIARLTKALEEHRFKLFYQPILPLKRHNHLPKKLEILIRMVDENNEIIMPADFIPAAERYNLMPAIDRWVIQHTLEFYRDLLEKLPSGREMDLFCINLSASSLADERCFEFIKQQFTATGAPPSGFCFEITETAAISNMAVASKLIHELKELGSTFALDDFGSGFSSFNYLKNLPIDYLKIDGSFVKDMDKDSVNRAMVEAINNLGHVMGITTIAEFVSTQEVKERLITIGVDFGQGYELGKPKDITHYKEHLLSKVLE